MRVAEFDRELVLRSAMNEFMSKGFNKTSMQDLRQATGLHPGSIYCAFGNKRGILVAALEHYSKKRTAEFETIFSESSSIMDGLNSYMSMIVTECECNEIKDCLLQKALGELAQQDEEVELIIRDMLNTWKLGLQTKLEDAQKAGEIGPDADCVFLANYLVMNIYGLRSFAHSKPEPVILHRLVDYILMTIKSS